MPVDTPADAIQAGPPVDRDEFRARVQAMWEGVAGAWGANAAFVKSRGLGVSAQMLDAASLAPGARVLELACGVGGVGLEAAELVGPGGEIVQSDVAPSMMALAAERATALGLGNVRTRVLDLEQIDEPDDSFDAVLCREGLMLVPDPGLAAREIRRVLRPGGRVVLSVWGPRAQNPWLSVVFEVVAEQLDAPMPPPGVPHPFSLEDRAQLASLLDAAGLGQIEIGDLSTPYRATSAEEWWRRTAAMAGPLAKKLAALPEDRALLLAAKTAEAISAYETPDGLDIPGLSLIASARRPL